MVIKTTIEILERYEYEYQDLLEIGGTTEKYSDEFQDTFNKKWIDLKFLNNILDNFKNENFDWYHTYGKVKVWRESSQPDVFVEDFARYVIKEIKNKILSYEKKHEMGEKK